MVTPASATMQSSTRQPHYGRCCSGKVSLESGIVMIRNVQKKSSYWIQLAHAAQCYLLTHPHLNPRKKQKATLLFPGFCSADKKSNKKKQKSKKARKEIAIIWHQDNTPSDIV
jgi:hypothetical protein